MSKGGFRELKVWSKGKDLAVIIYKLTKEIPFNRDFGLRDQMRRAAVSIPSNIAEGDERNTDKEAVKFFYVSKGSAAELLTQLIIANEIGYLSCSAFAELESECLEISRMLSRLIAARSVNGAKADV
jgi:four helix bundle protein